MFRRVLEGREKRLGSDHPDTLRVLKNLVVLLEAQGKFLKSAQILMTQLGPSHPRSIKVITALRRLHGLGDATQSTHGAAKGCPGKQSCSSEQRAACKTPC